MKVALKIERDSWNSHPQDYLEFDLEDNSDNTVAIYIKSEPERYIEFSKEEFAQLCNLFLKSPEVDK